MPHDFLLEIGCEELPTAAVLALSEALGEGIRRACTEAKVAFQGLQVFGAPRRLGFLIEQLAEEIPAEQIQKRGPALQAAYDASGEPTGALRGFLKSCGASLSDIRTQETEKGAWVVCDQVIPAKSSAELLPLLVEQVIKSLPIAKPMRWGIGEFLFVRPVHWLVMLLDDRILPATILGVSADRYTRGHRFHAPDALLIPHASAYEALLEAHYVIPSFAKRKKKIAQQIQALAATKKAQALMSEALLTEVTSVVEWPVALLAPFSAHFLEVPAEALIAAMESHQKSFAVQNSALLPYFITIANLESPHPEQIIAGNTRVMEARLSDADFFYRQDKKQALHDYLESTQQVVFQARLGSLYDKTQRMRLLMKDWAPLLDIDMQVAYRAVELSKCDLMTGIVGEFPELQGIMGRHYALASQESTLLASALEEQYYPRFSGDILPESQLGKALSLCDRLDTLIGIFGVGLKPTGEKDPYKLRRHAIALLRLLIEMPKAFSLSESLAHAQACFPKGLLQDGVAEEVQSFVWERLFVYYAAQGVSQELVDAVRLSGKDNLYDLDQRLQALRLFHVRPESEALFAGSKRIYNVLLQAKREIGLVDSTKFQHPAEQALWDMCEKLRAQCQTKIQQGAYLEILQELLPLHAPIDAFFDSVMIFVEDPLVAQNRLALLQSVQALLSTVAVLGRLSSQAL
ncbi:MAG: glycine--tRNA ligase subunit beta [Legionellaceae bacterium]|nr:glycine--tRNA ligase subunit beta [Legionellaceae bacterium]